MLPPGPAAGAFGDLSSQLRELLVALPPNSRCCWASPTWGDPLSSAPARLALPLRCFGLLLVQGGRRRSVCAVDLQWFLVSSRSSEVAAGYVNSGQLAHCGCAQLLAPVRRG